MSNYEKYITERLKERGLTPVFKDGKIVSYKPKEEEETIELTEEDKEAIRHEIERYKRFEDKEFYEGYIRELEKILKSGKIKVGGG